ncbi:hypothetical protein P3U41_05845 [Mammaliicoccus sciuri]|uniref:hypothetical protein n=1 Tax=Mammaliicoccus sciuri TaxID=1296 RepID=UPI002B26157D|nr:hypothetical protein [Mammaliicoccus sciuri]WQL34292.1 hypothetical protein P3U41_05845 [Mammaliicoccus sciuri]WQL61231.1 hypothetical protein P3T96_05845 [Mammaliicoccus sciuri]
MENDYIVGLIKFISPEYSDDFENDKLYFNTLQTYHGIEHEEIGDNLEGVISKKYGDENVQNGLTLCYQIKGDPKVYSFPINTAVDKITPVKAEEMYINCFSELWFSDLELYKDNILKVKETYIESLKDIHDGRNIYVTAGAEKDSFLKAVERYGHTNGFDFIGKGVTYFKNTHPMYNNLKNTKKLSRDDYINSCFCKNIKYQNQNEYRLLFIGLKSNIVEIKNMYKDWIKVDSLKDIKVVTGTKEEVEKYLK